MRTAALLLFALPRLVLADDTTGNPTHGKALFQQSCAICHADHLDPSGREITGQGPSLVGVFGRRAAGSLAYSYTQAMANSGLTWDAPTLDRFLAGPQTLVPGTTMPAVVPSAVDRHDLIAYLQTLKAPASVATTSTAAATAPASSADTGDWREAHPGQTHHFMVADLPAPYATRSAGNGPHTVAMPPGASVSVPPGFTARIFASRLSNPRLVRVAPNGDIFVAETAANRLHVFRAPDGADTPVENGVFAENLDRPFGLAFYPPGDHPQWLYVANNNSVVRIPYVAGDLQARGDTEVIVPKLTDSYGGHSTRDIAFSADGKRLFISVGSGSNVAEGMSRKSVEEAQDWEKNHGRGAGWDAEANRAQILVTDPEGHAPVRAFATGIRNGVSIAVNPTTGQLWTATNERDGLGDDLVPDYITRVREGGFYGWPWFYLGDHEDPRHAGERPDLAHQAILPDVLVQSHSAPLGMTFYTATGGPAAFPAEYRGDIFAALHGSWNRSIRTGYKLIRVRLHNGSATGEYDDFLTGFVVDDASVWGRPVAVAVAHDGALLMTEDGHGTLWRIAYREPSK